MSNFNGGFDQAQNGNGPMEGQIPGNMQVASGAQSVSNEAARTLWLVH